MTNLNPSAFVMVLFMVPRMVARGPSSASSFSLCSIWLRLSSSSSLTWTKISLCATSPSANASIHRINPSDLQILSIGCMVYFSILTTQLNDANRKPSHREQRWPTSDRQKELGRKVPRQGRDAWKRVWSFRSSCWHQLIYVLLKYKLFSFFNCYHSFT